MFSVMVFIFDSKVRLCEYQLVWSTPFGVSFLVVKSRHPIAV